ncbi:MAG: lamin tail domain-containing protein [Flavobacteriales bacterium]|nr:lamin tail domain-containing protein [Flavobacteriales bacterium]
MIKHILFLTCLTLTTLFVSAQFQDNFSDGDFTNNPTWIGETSNFEIDGTNALHLNAPTTSDTSYLSVASDTIDNSFWEFLVQMDFGTSSSNYAQVYLVSDNSDLKGDVNGYFVRIGGTSDEVSLYEQTGTSSSEIIDGLDGRVGTSTVLARIRVTRDGVGNWALMVDSAGGTTFVSEGTTLDVTHTTTSFFGVYSRYTSTRSDKFWFDDIYVSEVFSDITPPIIDSIKVLNTTSIDVYFSENIDVTSGTTLTNYFIANAQESSTAATIDASDSSLVHLAFSTAFLNGQNDTLFISAVEDRSSNVMISDTFPFFYFTSVAPSYKDIVFNEIFADPSPQVYLPTVEFVELYNASSNIYDMSGWQFVNSTTVKTMPSLLLYPDSFVILCHVNDTTTFQSYGYVVGFSSWTALTNGGDSLTLLDNSGTTVDIVSYDISWYNDVIKDGGGWSLELINPISPCDASPSNWSASNDTIGGTPGEQNSIYSVVADVAAPDLVSLTIVNDSTIQLFFSETMDSASLATGVYAFTGGVSLDFVQTVASDLQSVTLVLAASIDTGTFYSVTVNSVTDCPGNIISASNSLQFVIGSEPVAGQVVINEIFADPDPIIGLPASEYIELYNTSTKLIDLSGTYFNGALISPGNILPNDYMVICSTSDTALFTAYNNVIGIASFPTLTNGGKLLTFENASNQLIDQVEYDISWYQDAVKDNGGWSLERINSVTSCSFESNWIASNDVSGGTPGTENSVFDTIPDTNSPNLVSVVVLDTNQMQLTFNEPMDSTSLANGIYTINNGLSATNSAVSVSPFTSTTLTLDANIDTAFAYTVIVSGITDCPGNDLGNNTGDFVIGFPAMPNAVVINEIMCDPTPSVSLPGKEFVELYNTTAQLIDLSNVLFDGAELPVNTFIDPNGYLILCSINDTDEFNGFGNIAGLVSFPSLTNGGELIDLVDAQGNIIDQIDYSDDWYLDNEKDDGGWSLEKKNPTAICNGSTNWAAANNFLGGTPGAQNSIYDASPDQNLPALTDVVITSALTIKLAFSEPMDSASLVAGTYTISGGISVFSATTLGSPFDSVFLFFNSALDTGITYTVTVTGVTDCPGNSIGTPNSIEFILAPTPAFGDVVINEIFADPSPIIGLPDQEFIELFNTTNKVINLSRCKYDGANIPDGTYIVANGFVILCEDEDTLLFSQYGTVIGLSSWPSLTNGGETITLANASGTIIDQVSYNSSWYADSEKDNGGYTLERVNPFSVCNFDNNWQASTDTSGGTPGTQNSVYNLAPDAISPNLVKVLVNSSTEIIAVFSEGMNFSSLLAGNYSINNNITIDSIQLDNTNYYGLTLFISPISTSTIYTLTTDNITDCPGNLIADNTADFVLPENGEPGDIILNEILFNPLTGGSDFVEVYNNSPRYIDISKWSLASYDFDTDTIDNIKPIDSEQYIVYPDSYALITKDTITTLSYYPLSAQNTFVEISSLPTYSNDDGTVILITQDNEVSDRFDYDSDMHFPLLTDDKGVSLERLDFDRETNDYTNWHSAAENIGFATPGYENSQYQPTEAPNNNIGVDPEIFSPDQDGYNDVLNISYKLPEPGYVGTVLIYDAKGRLVRQLMNNELLGPEGTISWDGTNDINEKSRIGIYIIFFSAYTTTGDVINEKITCVLASQL